MITVSTKLLVALLRNKGMLTVGQLSKETGINRLTLAAILNGKRTIVQKETYSKLVDWLADKTAEVK